MNKRGAEMGTVIVFIVLAVIAAVLLIVGLTGGWGTFKERVLGVFGGGGNNVDTVKQACEVACATRSTYDFCTKTRELRVEGQAAKSGTCTSFSKEVDTQGITSCSDIACA